MATFSITSSLPDLDSIEADSFFIAEGFVHFQRRIGNSDVTIFAVGATFVEAVRRDA